MVFTFSTVANLLKLRRHSTLESSSSEDSTDDGPSPSSHAAPLPSSSTLQTHNLPITAATPSTPNQERIAKHFSYDTPASSKSSTSPGSPSSPSSSSSYCHPSSAPASLSSPLSQTKQKPRRTETTSGKEPLSHPGLAELACERREPVERTDTYLCTGGVNVLILLRMTRTELMDTVSLLGANALVEEQWRCTIYGPKNKGTYKVQVHYKACGTRSTLPDPHQPVAVDEIHSIPGLMSILRRSND